MSSLKVSFPKLRSWQKELFESGERFKVLVVHRRRGKTIRSILYIITKALSDTEWSHFAYIAPTYKQAKNIAWSTLIKRTKLIPWAKSNVSELSIVFNNGAKIQLFWADNPDSLRGLDLKGVLFDEYAQQPPNIYWEIVLPMLIANGWWAIWIGTPKGSVNHFFELYNKGLKDRTYRVIYKPYTATGLLTDEDIEMAKKEMTEEEFEQEYNLSWTANLKWAYYKGELSEMYKDGRCKPWIYDPLLPVYTFWDLWMSDYTAILFVQIFGKEIRIIDSHSENGKSLQWYAKILKEKPYAYEKHYFPHDIAVKELWTGMSRLEVVRKLFWNGKCMVVKRLGVADGINAARLAFKNYWFDEKNTETLRAALSSYVQEYDDGKWVYKDKPKHDWSSHYADAFRYLGIMSRYLTKDTTTTWLVIQDGWYDNF